MSQASQQETAADRNRTPKQSSDPSSVGKNAPPMPLVTDTVGAKLRALSDTLSTAPPADDATKTLRSSYQTLEKAYESLDATLDAYRSVRADLIDQPLSDAKCQKADVEGWAHSVDESVKNTVNKLKDTYGAIEKKLTTAVTTADANLSAISSSTEKAVRQAQRAAAQHQYGLGFADHAKAWFTLLDELYTQAKQQFDTKQQGALFATWLEFERVYKEASGLSGTYSVRWLRDELNESLKKWIDAVRVRYSSESTRSERESELETRTAQRDEFLKDKRTDFIREAAQL